MATQLLHKRSGLITDCMNRAALNHFDGMERKMRKLMITTVILVLAGGSANMHAVACMVLENSA
jgi:hypothetical protein